MDYKDVFDMICRILQLVCMILKLIRDIRHLQDRHLDANRIMADVCIFLYLIVPMVGSAVLIVISLVKN